jgi:hypothetical protein
MKKNNFLFKLFVKPAFFLVLITLVLNTGNLYPCTAAVVSGKVTMDGRPLLWKNRDTSDPNNKVVFLVGEKYRFIAVTNAGDKKPVHVWQGLNCQGFAIMNTASGDLAPGQTDISQNGIFMKRALGECADVTEFEALLEATNGQRFVAANYGVIDAWGNACFFETGKDSYVKFDANDPQTAPQGFIVRTNYAFSAPVKNQGGGYIRYERAQNLFKQEAAANNLTHRFILQEAARDLVNVKLHTDPLSLANLSNDKNPVYVNTNDTINRISTMSVSVFHGAPSPDLAYLATMWVILGQPVASVSVPLWVSAEGVPDELTGESTAPLCDLSRKLVDFLYDDQRGHMPQYMNATKLINPEDGGLLPILLGIENAVLMDTRVKQMEWQNKKPSAQEVLDFERRIVSRVYQNLKKAFPEITK